MPSTRISHRPSFATSAVRDLLTVGDSESPIAFNTSSLPVMPLFASLLAQMYAGTIRWADLLCDDTPVVLPDFGPLPTRPVPTTEADFKSVFADTPLQERIADIYDTSALTDTQFRAVMEWLCQNGWKVDDYNRNFVSAWPGLTPDYSTNWHDIHGLLDKEPEHRHHDGCCGKKVVALSAAGSDEGRRVAAPVPRFCRDAHSCQKRGCPYVHGNTIPRLNEPCRFGAGCGSSDPTGVKRSQCLRMHPGEHYHPEMVIKRV
jgi:hypothetical protein